MKTKNRFLIPVTAALLLLVACGQTSTDSTTGTGNEPPADLGTAGQSAVSDDHSQRNVVQVAIGSPDHTTLVTAITTAGLVDALSNVGPFTVFAPTNAAFDALPAGTVEGLLKPESKAALTNILEYHVYVGVIRENLVQDGMVLNQVNGQNVTLNKTGNDITVNGAKVIGSVTASNGIIYVIDKVLVPEEKK